MISREKKILKHELRAGPEPGRLAETQDKCFEILKIGTESGQRTDFMRFLAEVFRLTGISMCYSYGGLMLVICAAMLFLPGNPAVLPAFMPLFVLICVLSLYKSRLCGMEEMEAAARNSGIQLIAAKLILAGAFDLVCLSVIFILAAVLNIYDMNLLQLILYMLVPLLFCSVISLFFMRRCARGGFKLSVAVCLSVCLMLGGIGLRLPHLYEISAIGIWIQAFAVFFVFFIKEIYHIAKLRKEGKIHGIIGQQADKAF